MNLIIHCTRQQVALIGAAVGKLHIERDGTKRIIVPSWIEQMWKAAKLYEMRIAYCQINGKALPVMESYHSHPHTIKEHKR